MIAGIDVGLTGGIAILDTDGTLVNVYDMPTLSDGKRRGYDGPAIRDIFVDNDVTMVAIEKAQTMPGDGKVGVGNYMKGAGMLEGICIGLQIPYTLVHPATWKKAMLSDMGKGKEASIVKVKQLYPSWKMTRKKDHGICDAILIGLFSRRQM